MHPTLNRLVRHLAAAAALAIAPAAWAVGQLAVQPAPAGHIFGDRSASTAPWGYVEQEFFISGLAARYKAGGSWGADGRWPLKLVSANTPFVTRIGVRRPADPARFNGMVVVEWLNVSSGFDIDVDWSMSHEEFLREGYAYVGVTIQKVGVQGLQKANAARYGGLSIPDDKISFDILSQVAKAVREQSGAVLGGLQPQKVFATGHSQSAAYMITYANAFQPQDKAFDGIVIHGSSTTGVAVASGESVPSGTIVRSDLDAPVFRLQTEMDVSISPGTSKTMDTPRLRYWEVAGASHADQYLLDQIYEISDTEVGFHPPACLQQHNAMPFHRVENAAWNALKLWTTQGIAPPVAPRIKRDFFGYIRRDADGNALGGLRLPEIDVPVAKYGISNFTTGSLAFLDLFACVAGGSTEPFSAGKLARRYPTHADYVAKYKAAADAALAAGFLRPADHAKAIQQAQDAKVPN
jgi:hypothetical protein